MGNNIDIDLFTQKSEITTSTPDITIEITGLVQLNSFIGLDDTPTYYENGKFFKVEDNKIVYTDINWSDVKGKIKDNPELVKEIGEFIQKETEQYTSEAVTKVIKAHDADANAHQSIQLTIQDNYTILDNKIELNKIDSNTKFDEVNKKVSDNTEYITRVDNYSQEVNKKLEDLTLEVDVDIKGDIKQLRDDLTTTNQTVQDNYTALDTKIDNVSKDVQNNYTALDTRISANTKDISDLTQTVQNDYKELNDHITDVNSKVATNTTNINKNTELINQTVENLKKYSKTEDFATVAFTGRYADLIDIPNNIATTEYVDGKIGEVVQFSFLIVDELPKVGETNHIYLVLNKIGKTGNIYLEYLWIESTQSYELIGSTEVDLSGYYTKEQTDNLLTQKVDKVDGKSLILDTEIERLGTLKNYDDTDIKQSVSDLSTKVDTKQDKLTAGTGIKIENNVISNTQTSAVWGNIQGDITAQEDLQNTLNTKVDKVEGKSLILDTEIERLKDVHNYDDTKVKKDITDLSVKVETKQDKLTAGTGLEILPDGTINNTKTSAVWGDITGDIANQKDLKTKLDTKVDKVNGKSLVLDTEIERLGTLKNYDDTDIRQSVSDLSTKVDTKQDKLTFDTVPTADSTNPVTSGGIKNALEDITIKVDNTTISKSTENVISTIGIKTKNDINAYDWIGTQSEYTTDLASGVITETTRCYITDDEQELIGDIGVSIPTKVSDLSNDSGFVNQQELDAKQDKLTAGNGISIQNNIISSTGSSVKWGNITGSISGQKDLYDSLARKVTKVEGKSLISNTEIDRLKNVHNYDDTELRSTRATTDLSNLTTTGEKHFLNKSQITNCLLEIPQRIKYTLVDGVLTILKGSVCIVPYGTEDKTADLPKGATFINENFKVYDTQYTEDSDGKGKFFVWAELVNDLSDGDKTALDNLTRLLEIDLVNNNFIHYIDTISGTTDYSGAGNQLLYKTDENIIKRWAQGSNISNVVSFPLGFIKSDSSTKLVYSSIDEVFNGMGVIGSTIWLDKGVKGLIPNGRNADGSLINEEVVIDKLNIITLGNYTEPAAILAYLSEKLWDNQLDYVPNDIIYEQNAKPSIASNYRWYDTIKGKWYINDTGATVSKYSPWLKLADMSYVNGKITSFTPKLPFRALDYSDKTKITNWSFPSNKYIDLTLGASGTTYTAPADGWVFFQDTGNQPYSALVLRTLYYRTSLTPGSNGNPIMSLIMPVVKGGFFFAEYANITGENRIFRFIYAKGSEPTA